MFGLGASELVVIAILALLIVGPDGLPNAAKSIGKGIRDLRKQKEDLQNTIEKDTQIGEAVKELRSAMRGEPSRPSPMAHAEEQSIKGMIDKKTDMTANSDLDEDPNEAEVKDAPQIVSEETAVSRES